MPQSTIDGVGIGQDDEQIGLEFARQELGGEILVDHALDADQVPLLAGLVHGRDAAAAGGDHDRVALEQPFDRTQLEDPFGHRRRHHPSPLVAVLLEGPAFLLGQTVGVRFVVNGADELGRVLERRIAGIDLDHGQQGRERPLEREQVAQLLLDHVADHALGLGPEHVERVGLDLGVGGLLQRQQPHLRPIAMADDELMLLGDRGQRLARDAHVLALVLGSHRLPAPEERVAAEGGDDQHRPSPQAWRRGSP